MTSLVLAAACALAYGASDFLGGLRTGGLLSMVAVISSLYPASTLLLARYVLGERMSGRQLTGVALALGAIGLIAAT
ncbi:EamA family transporter [Nocardia concava]|uniref:EamA family transporter n=1 Tax=Nocardia concava TaxID=257281 RepID=UPI0002DE696B|nr:EamA family transporter [Nocardia concava]